MAGRKLDWFSLTALALVGISLTLFSTSGSVGATPDSARYVNIASNLLEGHGFGWSISGQQEPTTHFPPLYPTLLAVGGLFGFELMEAARWLNALLFGLNILLVGAVIRYLTCSRRLSLLGSFLVLSSIAAIFIHQMLLSDPLFILLGLAGMFLLAFYLDRLHVSILLLSALFVSLAVLTRYIGITLVITGCINLLLLQKKAWRWRFKETFVFVSISILPIGLWLLRNTLVANNVTNRVIVYHPLKLADIKLGAETILWWVRPAVEVFCVFVCALVPILLPRGSRILFTPVSHQAILVRSRVRADLFRQCRLKYLWIFMAFIPTYLIFLLISMSFFDAATPLDNRILLPVFVFGLVAFLSVGRVIDDLVREWPGLGTIFALFALTLVGVYGLYGLEWVINSRETGLGYTSRRWWQSEIVQRVQMFPKETLIATNTQGALYLLTGRKTVPFPLKVNAFTREVNSEYSSQFAALRDRLSEEGGIVVYLTINESPQELPTEEEIHDFLPLRCIIDSADGSIYQVD